MFRKCSLLDHALPDLDSLEAGHWCIHTTTQVWFEKIGRLIQRWWRQRETENIINYHKYSYLDGRLNHRKLINKKNLLKVEKIVINKKKLLLTKISDQASSNMLDQEIGFSMCQSFISIWKANASCQNKPKEWIVILKDHNN